VKLTVNGAEVIAAAAQAWQVPAEEVVIGSGVVSHPSGKRASFGEFAARAEQQPVPEDVRPKDRADYKLIGREGRLRVDAPPKILGRARFTIDVSLPGMVTAVVLDPPRFGARAAAIDDRAALNEPGVTAVVPIGEGLAVVAETLADAQRGVRALAVDWDAMGDDGILEVWAGTESPEYTRMAASAAAGIDKERVRVHVPYASGSFGLHSSAGHDPTTEAVEIARALDWKHPIKVQSLREEEFKSGRYRAMAVHRVRAGADAGGRLTAFHQQIAAQPTSVNLPFVGDVLFTGGV
jgi:CO/xanthine dehydrogenase Mo-binding subunit